MKKTIFALLAILMCFSIVIEAQSKLSRKDFRSPESLLRQVIDDSTNALRVEVVPMPENVTFGAAKTKKNQSFGHILNNLIDGDENRLKIEFTNFQLFPYDKLVNRWDSSSKVFKLYVDAENGSDTNDGTKMSLAKKTFAAVFAMFPRDMLDYEVYIFVHGGTYNENLTLVNDQHIKGKIIMEWVGEYWNTSTDAYAVWARNGETTIARNSDPVTINGYLKLSCNNLEWRFSALKPGIATWNKGVCARRWKFICPASGVSRLFEVFAGTLNLASGVDLDLGGSSNGIYVTGSSVLISKNLYVKGRAGESASSTSDWKGVIIVNAGARIELGGEDFVFADDFPMPSTNSFYFEDCLQAIWMGTSLTSTQRINIAKNVGVGWVDKVGTTIIFKLNTAFAGYCRYTSSNTVISCGSSQVYVLEDVTTSTITNYFSNTLYTQGANTILSGPAKVTEVATTPTITQDVEAAIFVKGDKLVITFNNGGTIKYWYLDLTSAEATWVYTTTAP